MSGSATQTNPPAPGAAVDLKPEGQTHELGPSEVATAGAGAGGLGAGHARCLVRELVLRSGRLVLRRGRLLGAAGAFASSFGDDQGSPTTGGGEHAGIANRW
jgi:hypothetical protein